MKKISILLFSCLLSLALFAQYSLDSAWIRDNYYKIERMVPMRDGVKLFTSIYIPKDTTEKHPVLLTRTPYSSAPYGEQNFKALLEQLPAIIPEGKLYHGYPGCTWPIYERR